MKVFPEYFDANQFIVPNYNSHFTIKRPYTNFAKSMRLNFEDYFVRQTFNPDKSQIAMCHFRQNMAKLFKPIRSQRSC